MSTVFDPTWQEITSPNRNPNSFFYFNYLQFENAIAQISDPHTRLTHFHLAILEQIALKHYAIAYQIYLDLASKRDEFMIEDYLLQEELTDVMNDITSSLKECGYPASHFDLA